MSVRQRQSISKSSNRRGGLSFTPIVQKSERKEAIVTSEELVFQEKGHKYFLDGEEIPSVSEITRFLSREVYGEIDSITLSRAAEKGTAVHKLTETLDREGSVECTEQEYVGYLKAYVKFHQEHEVKWQLIEKPIHMELDYAGTIDRFGLVDGVPCIVDIKTSRSVGKVHQVIYTAAQNMYRMALEDMGWIVSKLYILQLKPDGNYKLVELPIDFALAHSCLTLHAAFTAARRKKKKSN